MLELAELVIRMTGSVSQIIFQKLPEDDPKQRKPNIDLATKHLNWQPKIHLEEGLLETINYFRKVLLK
jgi:UDP-glucuronate decarboxylase